jgi:hypothetical protein
MKKKLITGIAVLVASGLVTMLSMLIPVGTDKSEVDTIGVQTRYGFPIPCRSTAPGMAWASFDDLALVANGIIWTGAFALIPTVITRVRNKQGVPTKTTLSKMARHFRRVRFTLASKMIW